MFERAMVDGAPQGLAVTPSEVENKHTYCSINIKHENNC